MSPTQKIPVKQKLEALRAGENRASSQRKKARQCRFSKTFLGKWEKQTHDLENSPPNAFRIDKGSAAKYPVLDTLLKTEYTSWREKGPKYDTVCVWNSVISIF